MALTQQQAKTAAKWWADKLRKPKFSALSNEERRRGDAVEMAEIIAQMFHKDPGEEAANRFEQALLKRLESPDWDERDNLSVDYGPDDTLSSALEEAGLGSEETALPWKTSMYFRNGGVEVRYGYGAPFEDLPLLES